MTCTVEMLPCDTCGREVHYFMIRVVTSEGERAFVCTECAGEKESSQTPESAVACD